ncbi:hypothetical protein Droror1_Dr00013330 [Drosera rotundifolia]
MLLMCFLPARKEKRAARFRIDCLQYGSRLPKKSLGTKKALKQAKSIGPNEGEVVCSKAKIFRQSRQSVISAQDEMNACKQRIAALKAEVVKEEKRLEGLIGKVSRAEAYY